MGSVIVFSTKSEKAHPVNRWFAGFFVCGREAAATKRGGAKPGQSEAGAERKNRAEEAEADAAADEKTSGRDTMPGRMFRFKECSLTYQSFNQMFFHTA